MIIHNSLVDRPYWLINDEYKKTAIKCHKEKKCMEHIIYS